MKISFSHKKVSETRYNFMFSHWNQWKILFVNAFRLPVPPNSLESSIKPSPRKPKKDIIGMLNLRPMIIKALLRDLWNSPLYSIWRVDRGPKFPIFPKTKREFQKNLEIWRICEKQEHYHQAPLIYKENKAVIRKIRPS